MFIADAFARLDSLCGADVPFEPCFQTNRKIHACGRNRDACGTFRRRGDLPAESDAGSGSKAEHFVCGTAYVCRHCPGGGGRRLRLGSACGASGILALLCGAAAAALGGSAARRHGSAKGGA